MTLRSCSLLPGHRGIVLKSLRYGTLLVALLICAGCDGVRHSVMDCHIKEKGSVFLAKAAIGSPWEDDWGKGEFLTEVCVDASGNSTERRIPARKVLEWAKEGKFDQ